MKTEEIFKLNLSNILIDYDKRQKKDYVAPKFSHNIEYRNHNTRNGTNLQVKKFNRKKILKSNVCESVKIRNSLPPTIKSASKWLMFKQKLKTLIISRYYMD